jgi:hypothetical protein
MKTTADRFVWLIQYQTKPGEKWETVVNWDFADVPYLYPSREFAASSIEAMRCDDHTEYRIIRRRLQITKARTPIKHVFRFIVQTRRADEIRWRTYCGADKHSPVIFDCKRRANGFAAWKRGLGFAARVRCVTVYINGVIA